MQRFLWAIVKHFVPRWTSVELLLAALVLSAVFLLGLYLPLSKLAENETRPHAHYLFRSSAREQLRRRGSF